MLDQCEEWPNSNPGFEKIDWGLAIGIFIILLIIILIDGYDKRKNQGDEDVKKLLEKIKQIPSIEEKTQSDLKDLRDFSDYKKICKLHPMGSCLDMYNYGGDCCEAKCPLLDYCGDLFEDRDLFESEGEELKQCNQNRKLEGQN